MVTSKSIIWQPSNKQQDRTNPDKAMIYFYHVFEKPHILNFENIDRDRETGFEVTIKLQKTKNLVHGFGSKRVAEQINDGKLDSDCESKF